MSLAPTLGRQTAGVLRLGGKSCVAWLLILVGALEVLASDWIIQGDSRWVLADREKGLQILGTRDEFIRQLSPFDRAARLDSDAPVDEARLLSFIEAQALEWSTAEVDRMRESTAEIARSLSRWKLPFPKQIHLVKSSGLEEAHAAYTRGESVILPVAKLNIPRGALERLLLHELFHVLSRANPKMRDELYGAIGFKKSAPLEPPPSYRSRQMTNPDAPVIEHWIAVEHQGTTVKVMPSLIARTETYSRARGWGFFEYLDFKLWVMDESGGQWKAKMLEDQPVRLSPEQVSGYFEQIGRNTRYIIHPEEILADQFVMLIQGANKPASPEALRKMEMILRRHP